MQELWNNFRIPVVVSGVGLVLALILGVAPLIGNGGSSGALREANNKVAEQASALEQFRSDQTASLEELRQQLATQARQLGDIQNRLVNLDRGVTRTFWRSKDNSDFIADVSDANQRLSDLEAQMDTLNSAVPRISARVRELQGNGE